MRESAGVRARARVLACTIKAIRVDYAYERRKPWQILLRQTKQAAIAERERPSTDYNDENINSPTLDQLCANRCSVRKFGYLVDLHESAIGKFYAWDGKKSETCGRVNFCFFLLSTNYELFDWPTLREIRKCSLRYNPLIRYIYSNWKIILQNSFNYREEGRKMLIGIAARSVNIGCEVWQWPQKCEYKGRRPCTDCNFWYQNTSIYTSIVPRLEMYHKIAECVNICDASLALCRSIGRQG